MKPKKYSYYTIDSGFLNAPVKLCFDAEAFSEILRDHGIQTKEKALELGQAETHFFQQDKAALIVMVFDFDDMQDDIDFSNIFATICHESVHCVARIWTYIGEDEPGEECVAYLTEHIAKQVLKGWTVERDKRARTGNRKTAQSTSKASGGSVVQVDLNGLGRAGQNHLLEQLGLLRGTQDSNRDTEPTPKDSV